MRATSRFIYKILAGFALIGGIMGFVFLIAVDTIDGSSALIKRTVDNQLRQLAQVNHLQSRANKIRLLEAELTKVTDIFATIGSVEELHKKIESLETDLESFLALPLPIQEQQRARLAKEWRLYVSDLQRTIRSVQQTNFTEAQRTSTFYSRPRFQTFAQSLKEVSTLIERDARERSNLSILQLERKRRTFLWLAVGGFGLGLFFAIAFSSSLSTRLSKLRSSAQLLAEGDFKQTINVGGNDEVTDLAAAFNTMRVELQKREDALRQAHNEQEQRVVERTAELAETNHILQKEIDVRRRTEAKLKELNRELDAFAYTLSHDLRSPLSVICSTADFLRESHRGRLDASADELLADIEAHSERMLALMEDLLALAQVGTVPRPTTAVRTQQVVARSIEALQNQFHKGNVAVKIGELPDLYIPETLLTQVVDNLLANALRYGCSGADSVIEIGSEQNSRLFRLFVRDHGPGVTATEKSRIFSVFYRGKVGRETDGTGIGLATVAKIASHYGGRAWVEDTPGGGATFWVELAGIGCPQ